MNYSTFTNTGFFFIFFPIILAFSYIYSICLSRQRFGVPNLVFLTQSWSQCCLRHLQIFLYFILTEKWSICEASGFLTSSSSISAFCLESAFKNKPCLKSNTCHGACFSEEISKYKIPSGLKAESQGQGSFFWESQVSLPISYIYICICIGYIVVKREYTYFTYNKESIPQQFKPFPQMSLSLTLSSMVAVGLLTPEPTAFYHVTFQRA